MSVPADVRKRLSSIDSAMSQEEADALWDLAAEARGTIVDIGTFHGYSAILMAMASEAHGTRQRVVTVDPFLNYLNDRGNPVPAFDARRFFVQHVKRLELGRRIVHLEMTAQAAAGHYWSDQHKEIGLLFIDGDHRPPAPIRDLEAWGWLVPSSGRVAVHDMWLPGPVEAVESALEDGWEEESRVSTLSVLRRKE